VYCLYALKGVGISLASLIDHSQSEVSLGQSRSRIIHLLIFSHVQYLIQQLLSCNYASFVWFIHLLMFPSGWTALWWSHLSYLFKGAYVYAYIYIYIYEICWAHPLHFLTCSLYYPGTGDLNLSVLQHWWLEFSFVVMIFILKRVRQGPLDPNTCHHRSAMHGQEMLKNIYTIVGVTDLLHVEVCSALKMEVFQQFLHKCEQSSHM
jgi:hypothetical protein